MFDLPKDDGDPNEFAALLEQNLPKPFVRYSPGDVVKARIVELGKTALLLDVGQRAEGSVDIAEFSPEELAALQLGDVIECKVVRLSASGIVLSRGLKTRNLDLEALAEASRNGIPVEGKVGATNKGGFTVDLPGSARGFVPFSQMDFGRLPPETYLNNTYRFKVLEVRGRDVVLSRTALLREEQAVERERLLSELTEGEFRRVRVLKHETFGIFVDLGAGGLNALVPASEVSWVRDESALPPIGTDVTVKIMRVDLTGERPRISASLRQAGENPWDGLSERLVVGGTVRGRVTRLTPYGAFVDVGGGIEGLLHVSEITGKARIRSAGDVLKPGQEVTVSVLSVDPAARRVSLSLKALEAREEDVDAEAQARMRVETSGRGAETRRWTPAAEPAATPAPTAFAEALRRAAERKADKDSRKGR